MPQTSPLMVQPAWGSCHLWPRPILAVAARATSHEGRVPPLVVKMACKRHHPFNAACGVNGQIGRFDIVSSVHFHTGDYRVGLWPAKGHMRHRAVCLLPSRPSRHRLPPKAAAGPHVLCADCEGIGRWLSGARRIYCGPALSVAAWSLLGLHERPQHGVHAGQMPFASLLEPL